MSLKIVVAAGVLGALATFYDGVDRPTDTLTQSIAADDGMDSDQVVERGRPAVRDAASQRWPAGDDWLVLKPEPASPTSMR
jgi:hypothetical protein